MARTMVKKITKALVFNFFLVICDFGCKDTVS